MDLSEESQKREVFREILKDLAKSQDVLKEKSDRVKMYGRLEKLYDAPDKEHEYRHFYSDIFGILTEIKNNAALGDINILGQNLSEIRKGYQSKHTRKDGTPINISTKITKLYDHVSLDIARMEYSDAGDWKVSGQQALAEIRGKTDNLERTTNKIAIENKRIRKDYKRMQRDYVAVLGIFSAILVAFFSGMGFSSSVLANIDKASIYRLILGILLLGIVLFNLIGMLINFIKEMVDKESINNWITFTGNIVFMILLIALYYAWKSELLGAYSF